MASWDEVGTCAIPPQVLHIDRNNYYGGQSASLNLNQVCSKAGVEQPGS